MKKLKDILYKVSIQTIIGSTEVDVKHITFDSRNVLKNSLFIALLGTDFDGHTFIDSAIKKGARVIFDILTLLKSCCYNNIYNN